MTIRWLTRWRTYRQTGIQKPQLMSCVAWDQLAQQAKQLQQAGWDEPAIKGYYRYVKHETQTIVDDEVMHERLDQLYRMTFLIGSPVYTALFNASRYLSSTKLALVLHQLEAYHDNNGFLQLRGPYRIDPMMAPTADFLYAFRHTVQQTFPHQTLKEYTQASINPDEHLRILAGKIHHFRSYIDRQCIMYIRTQQHGVTDYEKLLDYTEQYHLKLDYRTGANFHNRYHGIFTFPKNMKVQLTKDSKMSEFIVDLNTGEFISEWNVYRYLADGTVDSNAAHYTNSELEQVANTESFNYGQPRHRSHRYLDIDHPADPLIRQRATKHWRFERDYDDGGRYADIVNNGGHEDVLAWQKIPADSRLAAYQDYVSECRKLQLRREYGFNRFYLGLNEP